jgi:hypothetical protein
VISKSKCVEDMVSLEGIGVKGILEHLEDGGVPVAKYRRAIAGVP